MMNAYTLVLTCAFPALTRAFTLPSMLPGSLRPASLVGVLMPFAPSAAHAQVALPASLPPLDTYDPTVVGLVELLLLAGIVATIATSAGMARLASRLGRLEDKSVETFMFSERSRTEAGASRAKAVRAWLAGRKMPSLEELTYGCFRIAGRESHPPPGGSYDWFLCATAQGPACEPDDEFSAYYGRKVYVCAL